MGQRTTAQLVARATASSALAVALVAGCSNGTPTAGPSTPASPATTASSPATTPTETASATVTQTPTSTPSPTTALPSPRTASPSPTTPTSATTAPPPHSPTPPPTNACGVTTNPAPLVTTGMTAAAAATAKALYAAATSCDSAALAARATKDRTSLSFGSVTPQAAFALPAGKERYAALVTLLGLTPVRDVDSTVTPKVFSERYGSDEAAWAEVVRVGLITSAQEWQMRLDFGQYTGYRLGIATDGTWTYLIAGD